MQQSVKNNQNQLSFREANNVISSHKHNDFNNNSKGLKAINLSNYKEKVVTTKAKEVLPEMSFASIEGKCYCCGKTWQRSPACRHREKIPKARWAINKGKDKDKESSFILSEAKQKEIFARGWSVAHIPFQFYNHLI
jgi:hypothetical protein